MYGFFEDGGRVCQRFASPSVFVDSGDIGYRAIGRDRDAYRGRRN